MNREIDEIRLAFNLFKKELRKVFYPFLNLIKLRKSQKAFHPNSAFEILEIDPKIFAIKRYTEDQTIYAVTNICAAEVSFSLPEKETPGPMTDLITGDGVPADSITLKPYQYAWLMPEDL